VITVDVHAHTLVPEVFPLVSGQPGFRDEQEQQLRTFGRESVERNARLAAGEYAPLLTDTGSRLMAMDAAGIDVQAVSVIPTQYHYWADRGLASEIVSAVNERIATMARGRPGRLVGLATVALQHPDLAAAQLAEAVGKLGLRGAEISTSAAGRDLSDPYFEPFFLTAAELGAFVFIHPWGCTLGERLSSWYLGNIIGQPAETTLALSHLIFGGVLDRHPGLIVCGAHGGGYLPQYIGGADHAYAVRPESAAMKQPPSAYLRQIYFDTLVYTPETARQLIDVAGAGHVMLGTDYPFDMGVTDPLRRLDAVPGLSRDERAAMTGGTAARLLRITEPGS
jgi:aminocarboxymuconate-semialdehyde decarboxylase